MSLEKILSISGKPGLYELKAQTRSGFVAKSLNDGRKISVNMQQNISMLSEIAIYTQNDEIPLPEVFKKIYKREEGKKSLSHREPKKELRNYFEEILPDYDKERVYDNNIKKVFQWYNLLIDNGLTSFKEEKEEIATSEEEE